MAEYHNQHKEAMKTQDSNDRGLSDFTKDKDEEIISTQFEKKLMVSEIDHDTSSSSTYQSSDEEEYEEEEEEKRKKKEKKGREEVDNEVPVEKIHVEEEVYSEASEDDNEFLEKLPGHQAAGDDMACPPPPSPADVAHEGEVKEKKGLLEKIKNKIPGFYSKPTCEDQKETANE